MKLLICVMPLLAIFAVFEVVLVFALMKAAGNGDKQDELILAEIHHHQQKAETTEN